MKNRFVIIFLAFFYIAMLQAHGADKGISGTYNPRTGDTRLDATLGDLNIRTQGDNLSDFISNLSLSYNIPRIKIENLLFKAEMFPADVYMAVGLAEITHKPVDEVVSEYNKNKGKGWGVIARRLGIKPGSKGFKSLKDGGLAQLEKIKAKGKDEGKSKKKEKSKSKNRSRKKQEILFIHWNITHGSMK